MQGINFLALQYQLYLQTTSSTYNTKVPTFFSPEKSRLQSLLDFLFTIQLSSAMINCFAAIR
ncbi:MAG: hypothetical protein KDK36_10580 [Leptospiraceae bacterium]|nr:hypothetical protein [Leptospiraceae bacterium]